MLLQQFRMKVIKKKKKSNLKKGLIPYKKEDEEKALANGEVYNGVNGCRK